MNAVYSAVVGSASIIAGFAFTGFSTPLEDASSTMRFFVWFASLTVTFAALQTGVATFYCLVWRY